MCSLSSSLIAMFFLTLFVLPTPVSPFFSPFVDVKDSHSIEPVHVVQKEWPLHVKAVGLACQPLCNVKDIDTTFWNRFNVVEYCFNTFKGMCNVCKKLQSIYVFNVHLIYKYCRSNPNNNRSLWTF